MGIITVDCRLDCGHDRVNISRGGPTLNVIDQARQEGGRRLGSGDRSRSVYPLATPRALHRSLELLELTLGSIVYIFVTTFRYYLRVCAYPKCNRSGAVGRAAENQVLTTGVAQDTHWLLPERSIVH